MDEAINSHDHKSKKHKSEGKVPPIKSKQSNGDAVDTGCHRAGVDAFMTGTLLLALIVHELFYSTFFLEFIVMLIVGLTLTRHS